MNLYETMAATMSDDELMEMWRAAATEHKRRRKLRQGENKALLRSGDRVEFRVTGGVVTGKITRIKRVKALVEDSSGCVWDVRLGSLRKTV
jgi:hypothetical protein